MELVYEIKALDFTDRFEINFSDIDHTISIKSAPVSKQPWTELKSFQCQHCPLSDQTYCPVALQLSQLQSIYNRFKSYDTLQVSLIKENTQLNTTVTAQQLLTSLAGLLVAGTHQCTHTKLLYPMAKFHQPFASMDESIYRALANLALSYQIDSHELLYVEYVEEKYKNISILNRQLIKRLQVDAHAHEALINGIMNLETFSQGVLYNLKNNFCELTDLIT